ncbi:hypothetical protein B0T24DRAFT_718027 [Lasiosphaeria ovina]|uniref:Uncharacterized protein n=1 Tax=Lasiosphaeria ovina TaxID=92902 RepID=A0AAE0NFV4_9PEZI|nr:hypothetical protein B0T24DRAFT_718027 [Lasiosphaeria ovina]
MPNKKAKKVKSNKPILLPWVKDKFGVIIEKGIDESLKDLYTKNYGPLRRCPKDEVPRFCCDILDAEEWCEEYPEFKHPTAESIEELEIRFYDKVEELRDVVILFLENLSLADRFGDIFKDKHLDERAAFLEERRKLRDVIDWLAKHPRYEKRTKMGALRLRWNFGRKVEEICEVVFMHFRMIYNFKDYNRKDGVMDGMARLERNIEMYKRLFNKSCKSSMRSLKTFKW